MLIGQTTNIGKIIRANQKFSKEYPTNSKEGYQNFMLNLEKTKNIIQSDEFIYEVQKYYNWIFIYRISLNNAKKSNEKLINLLRSDMH